MSRVITRLDDLTSAVNLVEANPEVRIASIDRNWDIISVYTDEEGVLWLDIEPNNPDYMAFYELDIDRFSNEGGSCG